jgi:aflatoxin B1 aldehyde reductase
MSEDSYVALAIGTHTWAPNNMEKIQNIISIMQAHKIKTLDSARLYVSLLPNTISSSIVSN